MKDIFVGFLTGKVFISVSFSIAYYKQENRCKSGIAIFECTVTWKYAWIIIQYLQVDVTVYFLNVMYSSTLELVSEFQEKGLRVYADLLTDLESLKELPLDGDNRLLASKSRGKPTQVVYTEICRHCAEFKTIIVLAF